ncbi:hypothetical protein [Streptomyces sp. NPDC088725]
MADSPITTTDTHTPQQPQTEAPHLPLLGACGCGSGCGCGCQAGSPCQCG